MFKSKKIIFSFTLVAAVSLVATSCYKDREELLYPKFDCSKKQSTYSGDISAIFTSKCITCHRAGGDADGYSISNYQEVFDYRSSIQSDCLEGGNQMPKPGSPQLTDDEKAKLKCWLDNGAQNN